MDPEEFGVLQNNVGGFIQIEGFTSTAINVEQASGFYGGTWMEIRVKLENLGGEIDWGFADVDKISSKEGEKEILFNPINIFKVVECRTDHRVKMPGNTWVDVHQFVVLEYAALTDVMRRKRNGGALTTTEEAVSINYEYQHRTWMEKGFIGQGHAFYEGRAEERGLGWLMESLTFLEKNKK